MVQRGQPHASCRLLAGAAYGHGQGQVPVLIVVRRTRGNDTGGNRRGYAATLLFLAHLGRPAGQYRRSAKPAAGRHLAVDVHALLRAGTEQAVATLRTCRARGQGNQSAATDHRHVAAQVDHRCVVNNGLRNRQVGAWSKDQRPGVQRLQAWAWRAAVLASWFSMVTSARARSRGSKWRSCRPHRC